MPVAANQPEARTAIRTDLGAIFVSLELSRSTWLITSLSPGRGEKMSKHSVAAGDIAGLLDRFTQLQEGKARTGRRFAVIVIQEAGLDGFWIHRVLQTEGIESHVVDAASIAPHAGVVGPRPTGSTVRRWCARCWPTSGASRGMCDDQGADAKEEDRRRICRATQGPGGERVRHVNRIKGLLFARASSDYEPLRRDRRQRLEELRTGDGRVLPELSEDADQSRARPARTGDSPNQGGAGRARCPADNRPVADLPAATLLDLKGIGPECAAILYGQRDCSGTSTIADRSPPMRGSHRHLAERIGRSRARRLEGRQSTAANDDDRVGLAVAAQSTGFSAYPWFHDRVMRNGGRSRRQPSWPSPASCSSRCGST